MYSIMFPYQSWLKNCWIYAYSCSLANEASFCIDLQKNNGTYYIPRHAKTRFLFCTSLLLYQCSSTWQISWASIRQAGIKKETVLELEFLLELEDFLLESEFLLELRILLEFLLKIPVGIEFNSKMGMIPE